jgi:hypothetical protein
LKFIDPARHGSFLGIFGVKYETIFDGTLGIWKALPVDFKLKPNAVPYHGRAFPIPQSLLQHVKTECEQLCKTNLIHKAGIQEWAAPPSLIKPKKNKTVRFLTDFSEANDYIT